MRWWHEALAAQLFGPDVLPRDVLKGLLEAGIVTEDDIKAGGVLGVIGKLTRLGQAKAQDPKATGIRRPADLDQPVAPSRPRDSIPTPSGDGGGAAPFEPEAGAGGVGGAGEAPPSRPGGPGEPVGGEPPDADWQHFMAAAARRRGGALIVGLGNRVADDMTTTLISSDNELARQRRKRVGEAMAEGAGEPESVRQTRIRVVEAIGGEDYARDLDRIVATEAHHQVNEGLIQAVGLTARVAVITSPGACRTCQTLYGEGGKPKLFTAGALPPSSTNFRRKVVDWVATVPPLHPWCACTVIHVPAGWTVDAEGLLAPEGRS